MHMHTSSQNHGPFGRNKVNPEANPKERLIYKQPDKVFKVNCPKEVQQFFTRTQADSSVEPGKQARTKGECQQTEKH